MTTSTKYLCQLFERQRIVIADCPRYADLHFFDTDGYRPYRVMAPSIGNGFGGFIVGFGGYLRPSDMADMAATLHRSVAALTTLGFMTGNGGIFPVYQALCERGFGDNARLEKLLIEQPVTELFAASLERRGLWRSLDFFDGLAGYCFGLAGFGDARFEALERDVFPFFAQLLEGAMARRAQYDAPTPGFSHGFLGYAQALLAIHHRTGERHYLDLANQFRDLAHDLFVQGEDGPGRLRAVRSEASVYSMFCNGHIGLALHESYRARLGLDAKKIVTVGDDNLLFDTTYCHGTPSLFAALRTGFLVSEDPTLETRVEASMQEQVALLRAREKSLMGNMAWNYGALALFSEARDFRGTSLTTVLHAGLCETQAAQRFAA